MTPEPVTPESVIREALNRAQDIELSEFETASRPADVIVRVWQPALAALDSLVEERERLREASERISELQPRALGYITHNGFSWDTREDLGNEPGNWKHLAFSLYSDLCEVDSLARTALSGEGERP